MPSALSDLRRTRRIRRLGDTEWFDLAYRVYLAGIFGGSAIIIASDHVGDVPLDESAVADVLTHGPAVLGLVAVAALASGFRGGAEGGPIALESADVRHLLLAPIRRATVLRRPLVQRLRAVIGGAALVGGVAGLLAAQRMPGTAPVWTFAGAAFGACVGAIQVSAAAVVHALRIPAWVATAAGVHFLAWQVVAIASGVPGPADRLGSLALWGYRQRGVDLAGVAVVVGMIAAAVALVGRFSVEHLGRRGALVSQLRFAVTTQDLRTVVLLRRQMRQERPRRRSLVRMGARDGGAGWAVVRRGAHGLGRTPLARLGRMGAFAIGAGIAAGAAVNGTNAALIACGVLLFVLGLDLIEPLSQEIDHPDRTLALPQPEGWVHERLLVGPVLLAAPAALAGAAACALVAPGSAPAAFALAVPLAWVGMTGAIVSALRDDRAAAPASDLIVPPEVAGFRDLMRILGPLVVSSLGTLAILAVRARPGATVVLRSLGGIALYLAAVRWWIVHRAKIRRRWQSFVAGASA